MSVYYKLSYLALGARDLVDGNSTQESASSTARRGATRVITIVVPTSVFILVICAVML